MLNSIGGEGRLADQVEEGRISPLKDFPKLLTTVRSVSGSVTDKRDCVWNN